MIRHSKSLFISIIIHVFLLISIFFTWNYYVSAKEVDSNTMKEVDRVCISLCNVNPKKKIEKQNPKPKETKKYIDRLKAEDKKSNIEKPIPKLEKTEPSKIIPIKKEANVIEKSSEPKKETKTEKIEDKKVQEAEVEQAAQKSQAQLDEERKIKQENIIKEYLQINTQKIAELLQDNLYYPRSARNRNITGQIIVKFTLGVDSKVYDIVVLKSNSEILSRAAIKTIEDLSGKFPNPQGPITLRVPIGYELK